jgi:hypothetical protein
MAWTTCTEETFWREYEREFHPYSSEFDDAAAFLDGECLPRGRELLSLFERCGFSGHLNGCLDPRFQDDAFTWLCDVPYGRTIGLVAYAPRMLSQSHAWLRPVLGFLREPPEYQLVLETDFPENANDCRLIVRPDVLFLHGFIGDRTIAKTLAIPSGMEPSDADLDLAGALSG